MWRCGGVSNVTLFWGGAGQSAAHNRAGTYTDTPPQPDAPQCTCLRVLHRVFVHVFNGNLNNS